MAGVRSGEQGDGGQAVRGRGDRGSGPRALRAYNDREERPRTAVGAGPCGVYGLSRGQIVDFPSRKETARVAETHVKQVDDLNGPEQTPHGGLRRRLRSGDRACVEEGSPPPASSHAQAYRCRQAGRPSDADRRRWWTQMQEKAFRCRQADAMPSRTRDQLLVAGRGCACTHAGSCR